MWQLYWLQPNGKSQYSSRGESRYHQLFAYRSFRTFVVGHSKCPSFFSLELSHWISPRGRIYSLEATAYALLALVKAKVSFYLVWSPSVFNKYEHDKLPSWCSEITVYAKSVEKKYLSLLWSPLSLSYHLLLKLFEEARPVVRWFNNQPRSNAGFGSTQVKPSFWILLFAFSSKMNFVFIYLSP